MFTKRYEHDCKVCQFLGQYKEFDLYYCRPSKESSGKVMGGSVIARYSSEGSNYKSSDLSILLKSAINELAYGIGTMDNKTLPPRKGEPLHVAAARVFDNQRMVRIEFHRLEPDPLLDGD